MIGSLYSVCLSDHISTLNDRILVSLLVLVYIVSVCLFVCLSDLISTLDDRIFTLDICLYVSVSVRLSVCLSA